MGKNTPIVYSSGGHQLSFKLSFATDSENKSNPSITSVTEQNDNTVTYKSTYQDIDLRHIALNNEVKEDWIMNKYNGINEFHYTEPIRDEKTYVKNEEKSVWDGRVISSFLAALAFLAVGFFQVWIYTNSESGDSINAHVGGDAYNYIIKATQGTVSRLPKV